MFTELETMSRVEAIRRRGASDIGGKHGKAQSPAIYAQSMPPGKYVRALVPLKHLDISHDSTSQPRVDDYAGRHTQAPSVYAKYRISGTRRGKPGVAWVADGNHRAAAAQQRGETHIDTMMHHDEYQAFKKDAMSQREPQVDSIVRRLQAGVPVDEALSELTVGMQDFTDISPRLSVTAVGRWAAHRDDIVSGLRRIKNTKPGRDVLALMGKYGLTRNYTESFHENAGSGGDTVSDYSQLYSKFADPAYLANNFDVDVTDGYDDPSFICLQCGDEFDGKDEDAMHKHIQAEHGGERAAPVDTFGADQYGTDPNDEWPDEDLGGGEDEGDDFGDIGGGEGGGDESFADRAIAAELDESAETPGDLLKRRGWRYIYNTPTSEVYRHPRFHGHDLEVTHDGRWTHKSGEEQVTDGDGQALPEYLKSKFHLRGMPESVSEAEAVDNPGVDMALLRHGWSHSHEMAGRDVWKHAGHSGHEMHLDKQYGGDFTHKGPIVHAFPSFGQRDYGVIHSDAKKRLPNYLKSLSAKGFSVGHRQGKTGNEAVDVDALLDGDVSLSDVLGEDLLEDYATMKNTIRKHGWTKTGATNNGEGITYEHDGHKGHSIKVASNGKWSHSHPMGHMVGNGLASLSAHLGKIDKHDIGSQHDHLATMVAKLHKAGNSSSEISRQIKAFAGARGTSEARSFGNYGGIHPAPGGKLASPKMITGSPEKDVPDHHAVMLKHGFKFNSAVKLGSGEKNYVYNGQREKTPEASDGFKTHYANVFKSKGGGTAWQHSAMWTSKSEPHFHEEQHSGTDAASLDKHLSDYRAGKKFSESVSEAMDEYAKQNMKTVREFGWQAVGTHKGHTTVFDHDAHPEHSLYVGRQASNWEHFNQKGQMIANGNHKNLRDHLTAFHAGDSRGKNEARDINGRPIYKEPKSAPVHPEMHMVAIAHGWQRQKAKIGAAGVIDKYIHPKDVTESHGLDLHKQGHWQHYERQNRGGRNSGYSTQTIKAGDGAETLEQHLAAQRMGADESYDIKKKVVDEGRAAPPYEDSIWLHHPTLGTKSSTKFRDHDDLIKHLGWKLPGRTYDTVKRGYASASSVPRKTVKLYRASSVSSEIPNDVYDHYKDKYPEHKILTQDTDFAERCRAREARRATSRTDQLPERAIVSRS